MSLLKTLQHLFIPHESNNQKAKIIHTSSLFLLTIFLILFQVGLNIVPKKYPQVLGYASSIDPSEVIRLTNEQRKSQGLFILNESSVLSQAALAKGQDMLSKGYWAHFAPDGTTPWSFFSKFGYKYKFAGENLARDFSTPQTAVVAWMNSKTHRENILNPNYREIGIGVVEGNLNGIDTTIIVQFFGARQDTRPSIPNVKAENLINAPIASISGGEKDSMEVKISPFNSTKNISMSVVGIILLVFSLDLLIIRTKKITRIGGRTLAHLSYLGMILAVLLILKAGQII